MKIGVGLDQGLQAVVGQQALVGVGDVACAQLGEHGAGLGRGRLDARAAEYVVSTATLPALLPSAFFFMAAMFSATLVPFSSYALVSPVISQQVLSMRR